MSVERLVSTLPLAQHVTNYLQTRYYAKLLREFEIRAAEFGLKFMEIESFVLTGHGRSVGLEGGKLKDEVLSELAGAIASKRIVLLYPKLDDESAVDLVIDDEESGYSAMLILDMINAITEGGYCLVDTTEDANNMKKEERFSLK